MARIQRLHSVLTASSQRSLSVTTTSLQRLRRSHSDQEVSTARPQRVHSAHTAFPQRSHNALSCFRFWENKWNFVKNILFITCLPAFNEQKWLESVENETFQNQRLRHQPTNHHRLRHLPQNQCHHHPVRKLIRLNHIRQWPVAQMPNQKRSKSVLQTYPYHRKKIWRPGWSLMSLCITNSSTITKILGKRTLYGRLKQPA